MRILTKKIHTVHVNYVSVLYVSRFASRVLAVQSAVGMGHWVRGAGSRQCLNLNLLESLVWCGCVASSRIYATRTRYALVKVVA